MVNHTKINKINDLFFFINICMKSNGSTFCHMAFNNIHITQDGTTKPCCDYDGIDNKINVKNNSMPEIFHQKNFQEMRRDLIEGKEHSNCWRCFRREKLGKRSPRQIANKEFEHLTDIKPSKPTSVTMALSNLCNLGCRTCYPGNSSKLFNEYYDLFWKPKGISKKSKEIEYKDRRVLNESSILSLLDRDNLSDINELKFWGGEPMLDRSYWRLSKYFVDHDLAKNITVHFNTNATILPSKEHIDLFSRFKSININLSIDAIGAQFEYLRYGAIWKEVEKNISTFIDIKKKLKNINLTLVLTMSSINIFDINQTLKYYYKNLINEIDLWINNVDDPEYYSFESVPPKAKEIIYEKLKLIPKEIGSKNAHMILKIRAIQNLLGNAIFDPEKLKKMLEIIAKQDLYRKQDFATYFPEWSNILSANKI